MRCDPTRTGSLVGVRLSDAEIEGIRQAAQRTLCDLAVARVLLYGSRANPAQRGGDIDLLVVCDQPPAEPVAALTRRLLIALEDRMGERRVDVAWALPGRGNTFLYRDGHAGRGRAMARPPVNASPYLHDQIVVTDRAARPLASSHERVEKLAP